MKNSLKPARILTFSNPKQPFCHATLRAGKLGTGKLLETTIQPLEHAIGYLADFARKHGYQAVTISNYTKSEEGL